MTLTEIIANGATVKEGDIIATFDPAQQMDAAREAQGKFEDLTHQVEQKKAELRSSAEKRASDLLQAKGELTKAALELEKGPVLSLLDKERNEARASSARAHVASLEKSFAFREKSEAAALRILELQRDRQKINLQRAQDNIQLLQIRAPLAGMVVHELTYRAGSYGHAQVGDQIYRGYPLVSIFDPSEMQVRCGINEPDIHAALTVTKASLYLDAYPELAIPAHFVFSSPVASSPLGTPIKSFLAVFHIDKADPHLLPDLTAAIVLSTPAALAASGGAK
jgi:multidrug resistance efflux pump